MLLFVCVIKGAQIGPSLKNLAERHTDIFGSEETVIGRKIHTYIQYEVYICRKQLFIAGCMLSHTPPASCTSEHEITVGHLRFSECFWG